MKTLIFKSENKAKTYRVVSKKDQGIYKKDELIFVIKTDDIKAAISNSQQYQYEAIEVTEN